MSNTNKQVTIYSTPSCPYCRSEKQFLKDNGVVFIEIDVSQDSAKAQEMIDKSGQMGVPVTVITDDKGGEEIVVGFDQPKIASTLGIS